VFYERTGFPGVEVIMYDAEVEKFKGLPVSGGLRVDPVLHPFIIIRAQDVQEHKCARLPGCIRRLMNARAAAQGRLDMDIGRAFANVQAAGTLGEGSRDGVRSAGFGEESEDDVGSAGLGDVYTSNGFFNLSDIDIRPDVWVMVLFDEDPNDLDYVDDGSDGFFSEEEMGRSDEEDEAVETDREDERKVVIDLTNLSSSSVCSQEL
jgi:hypothetical protein